MQNVPQSPCVQLQWRAHLKKGGGGGGEGSRGGVTESKGGGHRVTFLAWHGKAKISSPISWGRDACHTREQVMSRSYEGVMLHIGECVRSNTCVYNHTFKVMYHIRDLFDISCNKWVIYVFDMTQSHSCITSAIFLTSHTIHECYMCLTWCDTSVIYLSQVRH